ncbi:MAG: prepilin-type N-terminal cleavage/methylation domain-containing protein [Papillibacter sp.]|nr:prepilin-type N-terminal cleavage/methylation domain-containing protein [Papillibacter sp.]
MKNKFTRKVLRSKKGFTLAELLSVIGIIAVLAAIAIPVFTGSMKKAEEAVEVANARAVYGEGMVAYITEEKIKTEKTIDGKTYTFTYEGADPWEITIKKADGSSAQVYNDSISDFSKVKINGIANDYYE